MSSKDKGFVLSSLLSLPFGWKADVKVGVETALLYHKIKVAYWEYESNKIEVQVSDDNEVSFP